MTIYIYVQAAANSNRTPGSAMGAQDHRVGGPEQVAGVTAAAAATPVLAATTLRGLVRSAQGKPLAGANVMFKLPGEKRGRLATSQADGSVVFEDISPALGFVEADGRRQGCRHLRHR